MSDLALPGLTGTNPLGFLAALGVLDILNGIDPNVTLRWTDELVPRAIVAGGLDYETLLDAVQADQQRQIQSSVLTFLGTGSPLPDAKPGKEDLRRWYEFVRDEDPYFDGALLCALVAEESFDGGGKAAKPTHLHFTAGQQRFLQMVRMLAASVDRSRIDEAVRGPWRYDSELPSLSWDVRGERVYAVRATNPSNDKRLGVPGADWLAFRGLVFYPVMRTENGGLRTTACNGKWKRSAFRWPLWSAPCSRQTAVSLVADSTLVGRWAERRPMDLFYRGVFQVLEAPIKRTDQGGYGSFGAPEVLATASVEMATRPGP
jgi:hypothetical protein